MSSQPIDYDALARQHGGSAASIDYDALAAQHGAQSSVPKQTLNPNQPGMQPAVNGLAPRDVSDKAAGTLDSLWQGIHNGAYAIPQMLQSLHDGTPSNDLQTKGVIRGSLDLIKKGFEQLNPIAPNRSQSPLDRTAETFGNVAGGAATAEMTPAPEDVALAQKVPSAVSDAIPTKAKAAAQFKDVMSAAKDMPVEINAAQDGALKMMEWQKKTQLGPTVNKFLNRITNPKLGPLTYEEARDFQQLLGKMSADETMKIPPAVRFDLTRMVVGLKQDVAATAGNVGKYSQYMGAMDQYRKAMQISDAIDQAKSLGVSALKYSAGAGLAGLAIRKGIDVATEK